MQRSPLDTGSQPTVTDPDAAFPIPVEPDDDKDLASGNSDHAQPKHSTTGSLAGTVQRLRHTRLAELARFGSVGAIAYVIDIGLFNLLVHGPGTILGHKPITAKIIAALVATVASWVGNRYWTFTTTKTDNPSRELAGFIVVNALGMGISALVLWFSRYVLDLTSALADNVAANIAIVLGTILRYVAYRYLIFTKKPE